MKTLTVLISVIAVSFNAFSAEKIQAPQSFFLSSGDLKIRFDSATFYNMKRIEYKSKLVGVDSPGTCYGTVFKFPDLGFIGSGHIDNGNMENLEHLELYQDGKAVNLETLNNNSELKGKEFKLLRRSLINGIRISNVIIIANNIIDEKITFSAVQDIKLSLVYNFMHPFTTEMDQFSVMTPAGKKEKGTFTGDGKFPFQNEFEWVAFFSSSLEICAASVLIENTCPGKSIAMIWDKPPRYRKFYLRSCQEQTAEKDQSISMRMRTAFAETTQREWESTAEKICNDLISK